MICGPRCVVRQVHLQNDLDTQKLQLQKLGRPLTASNQYSCIFLAWFGTKCGKKQKLHCFWNGTVITGFRPEPRVHVSSICESNTARYFCRIIFQLSPVVDPNIATVLKISWPNIDILRVLIIPCLDSSTQQFVVGSILHAITMDGEYLWLTPTMRFSSSWFHDCSWLTHTFLPRKVLLVHWYIHRVTGCSYPGLRSGPVFWGLISFSNAARKFILAQCYAVWNT